MTVPSPRVSSLRYSSWTEWSWKMGQAGSPEWSVNNYLPTLLNVPEQPRPVSHCSASLKPRTKYLLFRTE